MSPHFFLPHVPHDLAQHIFASFFFVFNIPPAAAHCAAGAGGGVGGVCTAFAAVCYGWKGRRGRKIRNGCKQNRWNVREMLETVETNLATSNVEGKKMEISTDFSFYILLKIKSRDNGR